ncbi:15076_t:CDS:2 [Cetraspora pellucida]|uniref:15076_t:CDS:1 n=1 Tax=Cetraspora pellucida TaxID=1433469 RepID=A0A9N9HMC1_9GLOM|nr:15076_t:CDS:2 [Cetraspora pellucida]
MSIKQNLKKTYDNDLVDRSILSNYSGRWYNLATKEWAYENSNIDSNLKSQFAYHNASHDIHLARNIWRGLRPNIPENIPKLINEFINKCWNAQQDKRPTAKEIHDTIRSWTLLLNDKSTEFFTQIKNADETRENFLESDTSTPTHFMMNHVSRRFDFLPLGNYTSDNG